MTVRRVTVAIPILADGSGAAPSSSTADARALLSLRALLASGYAPETRRPCIFGLAIKVDRAGQGSKLHLGRRRGKAPCKRFRQFVVG